jgi:hypothetical protein
VCVALLSALAHIANDRFFTKNVGSPWEIFSQVSCPSHGDSVSGVDVGAAEEERGVAVSCAAASSCACFDYANDHASGTSGD